MFEVQKHKINLTNLLVKLYKDSEIAPTLGFKGGTACYFFYDLPRLSVDLDFDFINLSKFNDEKKDKIIRKIEDILVKDYEILDSSKKLNTLFWLVSYEKGTRNIKIEISTRDYPNSYEYRNFYGTTINVLKIGDIIAHKLVAIQDRNTTANRDIFDAQYFLRTKYMDDINYEIIKYRTGLEKKEFLIGLLKFLEEYKSKSMVEGLGELVTNEQKDWIRSGAMVEDLKINLRILIGTFEG